jgi:plasmid stabilization system protein ParE
LSRGPIPIVWSRRSQADIQRLHRFLLPNSPRAAQRAVAEIRQSVLKLSAFPNAGRPIASLGGDRRELLIPFGDSGYALIYLFDGSAIQILSIRHQREAGY